MRQGSHHSASVAPPDSNDMPTSGPFDRHRRSQMPARRGFARRDWPATALLLRKMPGFGRYVKSGGSVEGRGADILPVAWANPAANSSGVMAATINGGRRRRSSRGSPSTRLIG